LDLPAAGDFRNEFTVPEDAIDGNGHVSNVAYVQWMQDVAVRHFASANGMGLMHTLAATWGVRSHCIEYLRAARRSDRGAHVGRELPARPIAASVRVCEGV